MYGHDMSARPVIEPPRELVDAAADALLTGPRFSAGAAARQLPDEPGLYAVFASPTSRAALQLPPLGKRLPIYVGKAEASLLDRDGRTHFAVGRTGQSTLRRVIAALLRDTLDIRGRPRNPKKPGYFDKFGLSPDHDDLVQVWIAAHLSIATWVKPTEEPDPTGGLLLAVERKLLARWTPPMNERDNPTPWSDLRAIRKVMADDARAWRLG